jgi:hypothetical protein
VTRCGARHILLSIPRSVRRRRDGRRDMHADPAAGSRRAISPPGASAPSRRGATQAQLAALAPYGPDTTLVAVNRPADLPDGPGKVARRYARMVARGGGR